jgi:hypothetical protein
VVDCCEEEEEEEEGEEEKKKSEWIGEVATDQATLGNFKLNSK